MLDAELLLLGDCAQKVLGDFRVPSLRILSGLRYSMSICGPRGARQASALPSSSAFCPSDRLPELRRSVNTEVWGQEAKNEG